MARTDSRLSAFADWLTHFGDAWESLDAAAMGPLLAVGATFQPTPFSEVIRGRRAIVAHFAGVLAGWTDVSFAAQVLGAGDTYGMAHYRVASRDRARDGVLVVALDARGRCESLRDWWHESGS